MSCSGLQVEAHVGEDGGQVFKVRAAAGFFGVHAVDRLDLQQPVMPLGFARRAHVPDDQVAGAQVVAAQLRLGDIHILFADAVMLRAQEADAFVHDLQDAAAHLDAFLFGFRLADADDQRFFFQPIGVGDVQVPGHAPKFCQGFVFKCNYVHDSFQDVYDEDVCQTRRCPQGNAGISLFSRRGIFYQGSRDDLKQAGRNIMLVQASVVIWSGKLYAL